MCLRGARLSFHKPASNSPADNPPDNIIVRMWGSYIHITPISSNSLLC
jgi:hypothetical protein